MSIVMGVDQHRAQITTEWIDTTSGEIGRARVSPAHRESVRRFLKRFEGHELEVALEATTGWRFVVEELQRVRTVLPDHHLQPMLGCSVYWSSTRNVQTWVVGSITMRE